MSYIDKIAFNLNRRDEVPNQELAKELAQSKDISGVDEIASYLNDKNQSISSDCLKVLYEIGYIDPSLIAPYLEQFIEFLDSKNNRMVWGSMIAIACIAKVNPDPIFKIKELILDKIENGTVITNVWGVYTIINLASTSYYNELKDTLFSLQKTCRSVDFAKRAESVIVVIDEEDMPDFIKLLEKRLPLLAAGGQKRVNKLLKKYK